MTVVYGKGGHCDFFEKQVDSETGKEGYKHFVTKAMIEYFAQIDKAMEESKWFEITY